jgi:FKBP-type peptidyl-prolyl cis-trans isomerase FkpA
MKPAICLLLSILVISTSCNNSPFPDFNHSPSGFYYKFYSIGEDRQPSQFDYIIIDAKFSRSENDTSFFYNDYTGLNFMQLSSNLKQGGLEQAISMMNKGDSAGFMIKKDDLSFFFKNKVPEDSVEYVYVTIKLLDVASPDQFQEHFRKFKNWLTQKDKEEKRRIEDFLASSGEEIHYQNGIYFQEIKSGKGDSIETGMAVSIHYTGTFLDGRIFDSTYDRGEPFDFLIGMEGQVIQGIETGIKMMKKGGKAKFILPSQLAYGEKGSSTGIIPPHATLVYEVEVLRVNYNKSIEKKLIID